MLPKHAPEKGEPWDEIIQDVERTIMPGITHWQHPRFHAYFPAGNSYPSILGEMLSAGLGVVGFSWAASPACTELETIMMDWLGKEIAVERSSAGLMIDFDVCLGRMMKLPVAFLPFDPRNDEKEDDEGDDDSSQETDEDDDDGFVQDGLHDPTSNGTDHQASKPSRHVGGGVLLVRIDMSVWPDDHLFRAKGSASECVLVAMLAARTKKIMSHRQADPLMEDGQILARLVCYTSKLVNEILSPLFPLHSTSTL